jgi:1,4-dihydroxy-2-naphthoate polyprenyltransferase
VGLPACAVLVANNLRDVDTDRVAGKRTLAVRIGAKTTTRLFVALLVGAFVAVVPIGLANHWAFIALAAAPLAIEPVRRVTTSTEPSALVRALVRTVRLSLALSVLLTIGLIVS